jgi:hypothetical protein
MRSKLKRYLWATALFAVLAAAVPAWSSLLTQSGPRLYVASASGITFNTGWSGSGTFADGQIVTLTKSGGGLSIPADPRPDYWLPLQNSVAKDATYSKSTSPTLTLQTNASFQTTVKPTGSTHALDQLFVSTNGTQPGSAGPTDPDTNFFTSSGGLAPAFSVTNGKFYISMDRYRTFDSQSSAINGKNLRVWAGNPGGGIQNIYISEGFIYSCNLETTATSISTLKGGADPEYSPFVHPQNAWFKDEWFYKESSSNTIDGYFEFVRNGSNAYGPTDRVWNTRPTDASNVKTVGFFSQYSSNGVPPDSSHEYVANIYVNSSGTFRVIISNESTYQTTNQGATNPGYIREPQLPVASSGSATGVQILIRKGSHASLSGKYLYLIDNTETVYYVGQFTSTFEVMRAINAQRREFLRGVDSANDPDFSTRVAA